MVLKNDHGYDLPVLYFTEPRTQRWLNWRWLGYKLSDFITLETSNRKLAITLAGKVGCHAEMEGRIFCSNGKGSNDKKAPPVSAGKQMLYVIGANVDGSVKDVTKR